MYDITFHAMLDTDIEGILMSLGVLDSIKNGEMFCSECGRLITAENLQMIIPGNDNKYRFVCNLITCVESHNSTAEE